MGELPQQEHDAASRRAMLTGLAVAAAIIAAVIALLFRLREPEAQPEPEVNQGPVNGFADFPVYWVGNAFRGYPLDHLVVPRAGDAGAPAVAVYGDCGQRYESGECQPPLVITSRSGCLGEVDDGLIIRERRAGYLSRVLMVQAGDVVVAVHGAKALALDAADQMVPASVAAFPALGSVAPGPALPGSVCELARLDPRATRAPDATRATPQPDTEASSAATVISAFGEMKLATTFQGAESILGWRVLRSDDPRLTLVVWGNGSIGSLRSLDGRPFRFQDLRYEVVGHRHFLQVTQEPESYPAYDPPSSAEARAGTWTGRLYRAGVDMAFTFYSGETVAGQRVRVSISGEGYTTAELLSLAATLAFGP